MHPELDFFYLSYVPNVILYLFKKFPNSDMIGQESLACPRPGLMNCLAAPPHSSATHVSALCADGTRLLERQVVGIDTCFPVPRKSNDNNGDNKIAASAHACAGSNIFVRVVSNYVVVAYGPQDTGTMLLPHLHYEVRALAACEVNNATVRIAVGGFDGAHTVELPSQPYSKKGNTSVSGYPMELRELPGTEGFSVVAIALAHDAIVVALLDGRAALWENRDSSPVGLLQPAQSKLLKSTDRITDVALVSGFIVVAYWTGAIIVYPRAPNLPPCLIVSALINSSPNGTECFTHGPTMLVKPPSFSGPQEHCHELNQIPVIAAVTDNGRVAFLDLTDGTIVAKAIQDTTFNVSVKGACSIQTDVLLWVADMSRMVSVKWPHASSFNQARQIATERRRLSQTRLRNKKKKGPSIEAEGASTTVNKKTIEKDVQAVPGDSDYET